MLDIPRKGDWMQTFTGRQFWPCDPRMADVDIEDIAHALSMQPRYGGHSKRFYSVAEHSVLVSSHCDGLANQRAALLHDASEAYLVDIPRPIKPYLINYKELEDDISKVIAEKFGVAYPWSAEVHRVDNAILADEQKLLMADPPAPWTLPEPPLGLKSIRGMAPAEAKAFFMGRFYELFT